MDSQVRGDLGISVFGDGGVPGAGVKVVDGGWRCQVCGKVNMGICCCLLERCDFFPSDIPLPCTILSSKSLFCDSYHTWPKHTSIF